MNTENRDYITKSVNELFKKLPIRFYMNIEEICNLGHTHKIRVPFELKVEILGRDTLGGYKKLVKIYYSANSLRTFVSTANKYIGEHAGFGYSSIEEAVARLEMELEKRNIIKKEYLGNDNE